MTTIPDIEVRRIREETIRDVIRGLMRNASDPERIGRRVLQWNFAITSAEQREKLVTFAKRLGVSESSASQSVAAAESAIFDVKNFTQVSSTDSPS